MLYKADSNHATIKRSVGGKPLRGGIRRYAPPKRPSQHKVMSPAQYIGANNLEMHLPELLRSEEHIRAVVFGEAAGGTALFSATNVRILIIIQSAQQVRAEEIVLGMVTGIGLERQGALTLLTVYTSSDAHTIRTLDRSAARHFAECVDVRYETRHIGRDMY